MKPRRLILAGGSGFLGQVLSAYFGERGWEVIVLTRRAGEAGADRQPGLSGASPRHILWDGETLGPWAEQLEGAGALINLAGVTVNCRYHARNRRRLVDSRILPTRILDGALAQCAAPPKVWLNASTATIYRHTFGPAWDEDGEIGAHPAAKDAFSIELMIKSRRVISRRLADEGFTFRFATMREAFQDLTSRA